MALSANIGFEQLMIGHNSGNTLLQKVGLLTK